ncbi:MAG TPA: alpha/beta fold hydrolase [Candidatus Melainabacteria bacterium]|mgnify:CR=1 FL=1|nr:alpha/beta fold hydrolase [Candidatus Melainabacteria bacterium]HIN67589.1 alpha/beta fold hydrolase [Candidatus Obscuribacterales bacterium]
MKTATAAISITLIFSVLFGASFGTMPVLAKQKQKQKQKKHSESSKVADRMLSDISPKLSTYKKDPISVIDGKMNDEKQQDGVKLAAAVLRLQPVDSDTPVARLKITGTLPFSNESDKDAIDAPRWQMLEAISPSTGEVVSKEPIKEIPLTGNESLFVRPAVGQKTTRVGGGLFDTSFGKIGPQFDALKLPVREWVNPMMPARGVVVMVHGTTQHSGSFELFANHLSGLGFKVIAYDMRGHGRWYHNQKTFDEGDHVNYSRSTNDLIVLLTHIRVKYPTLPLFCIGESIGGAVSVRAGSANPGLVDGLVLVSPGSKPCTFNPVMVAKDFAKGITHLDKLMDVTRYIKRYSSDDNRVTKEMVDDPLSRTELTGKEVLQTGYFISTTPKFASKLADHVSVLIVQGEEDRIVSPKTIKTIYKNLHVKNKAIVYLPDCGHVLLGTSFLKPQVVSSISNWLVKRSKEKAADITATHKKTPQG